MDENTQMYFENLNSEDKNIQYDAYTNIMEATNEQVDWAYDVWDQLKEDLTHPDHHRRSRAAQFLASLSKSDPSRIILEDFPAVWEVTKDPKFVTARHSLQAIWKVGLAGPKQKKMVVDHLVDRFRNCEDEKNYTLIRSDIIQGLRHLYDEVEDDEIEQKAMELVDTVEDSKYRKKYLGKWRKK
ncbi:hypothetical protein MUO14_06785 [Halobacillus shinanisalinarum]|uniref:HEAT repeat domain-containing protein n=1 Tax=Halobacillus shinanisalinarum TaxID=2932258 RepID=A0ABY4H2G6_9BACI|nr:hypothetical protein [Halobacillus shinanisalinarum]UOQ94648.1 hypothetical protein MUO14_06785 [Halobacillus shinanisalinarum]